MTVFNFFEKLSTIPRASKNEAAVADWIVSLAEKQGFAYYRDRLNNVLVKKPGSKGYENACPIILQAHMDMVCEKTADSPHDFTKDPIKFISENGFLKAHKTTLGADNGIGLSYILAVLHSTDLPHPPIEALFTVDEEAGMSGASAFDMRQLTGRRMLNMDSDGEGIFCLGCAGGMFAMMELPLSFIPAPSEALTYMLTVSGLKGGHSGIDINKGRANANIVLARALAQLSHMIAGCASIHGGSKDNAIPVFAKADILVMPDKVETVKQTLADFAAVVQNEFAKTEPDIVLQFTAIAKAKEMMKTADFDSLISAFLLAPSGMVYNRVAERGEANTSNNVAIVKTDSNKAYIHHFIRSNTNSRMQELADKLTILAKLIGASVQVKGTHGAWEEKPSSPLKELALSVYQTHTGKAAKTETIHAGLECAIFMQKMPELDIISFGPNLYDLHTINERADIASVERVWTYLCKLLAVMN